MGELWFESGINLPTIPVS
jgi:hypothetical protein